MKIVVIRSPKMLSGIFRMIFKIKKEEQ
ncbi:MAG: stage V sporulation protein SpoVM [Ruminococcus sp.]|nr:stage V sporulation protein SpoVM [Ruminococcus sp.]MBO5384115.1 stage V sporulation protein SpoVM [Ruminococcus sp.]